MESIRLVEPEVGKTVLLSLIYQDSDENITREEQHFGVIYNTTPHNVFINSSTGQEIRILSSYFIYAPRGEYTLRSTAERVRNPDMMTSWIITPADESRPYEEWEPNMMPLYGSTRVPKQFDWKYELDIVSIGRLIEEKRDFYIGKTVIVGIHHYLQSDPDKKILRHEQLFGMIEAIGYTEGQGGEIRIRLYNGKALSIPPDLTWLQPLRDDTYDLCDMDESVKNPDFYVRLYVANKTPDDMDKLQKP